MQDADRSGCPTSPPTQAPVVATPVAFIPVIPAGGYVKFMENRLDEEYLPVWLQVGGWAVDVFIPASVRCTAALAEGQARRGSMWEHRQRQPHVCALHHVGKGPSCGPGNTLRS